MYGVVLGDELRRGFANGCYIGIWRRMLRRLGRGGRMLI